MVEDLKQPNLESKIEKKVEATVKQNELKRNALQKFISEDISKQDYDDFVNMVQKKLQQLEIEKAEIKKAIVDKQATIKISAILEQLKAFLNFNALTTEM